MVIRTEGMCSSVWIMCLLWRCQSLAVFQPPFRSELYVQHLHHSSAVAWMQPCSRKHVFNVMVIIIESKRSFMRIILHMLPCVTRTDGIFVIVICHGIILPIRLTNLLCRQKQKKLLVHSIREWHEAALEKLDNKPCCF